MAAQLSWKDRMVVGKKVPLRFLGVCLPLPARSPASQLGCFWPELGRGSPPAPPSWNRLGEAATRSQHFGRQNRALKLHGRIFLKPVLASNVTLLFSQNQNKKLLSEAGTLGVVLLLHFSMIGESTHSQDGWQTQAQGETHLHPPPLPGLWNRLKGRHPMSQPLRFRGA